MIDKNIYKFGDDPNKLDLINEDSIIVCKEECHHVWFRAI